MTYGLRVDPPSEPGGYKGPAFYYLLAQLSGTPSDSVALAVIWEIAREARASGLRGEAYASACLGEADALGIDGVAVLTRALAGGAA